MSCFKWYFCFFLIVLSINASAHRLGESKVRLSILDQHITGTAYLPSEELDVAMGYPVSNYNTEDCREYLRSHLRVFSGSPWETKILSIHLEDSFDEEYGRFKNVVVTFILVPHSVSQLREFTVRFDAIVREVRSHKILVFIDYDWANGVQEGEGRGAFGVIGFDRTVGEIEPLIVDLEPGSWWKGFGGMFHYGAHHIRVGLDHVLFLITLLLVAPLAIQDRKWSLFQGTRHTVRRFLSVSISFTIGHSLTLFLGAFNLFTFKVQYVEVFIAISILISALNCIRPVFYMKEVIIAGLFGLIHGLAFSSSLSHFELTFKNKLLSVLGFNLGIEFMQLLIMLLFFPVLLLSKWKFYIPLRIGVALVTIVVSIAWVAERISGDSNWVTSFLSQFFI